LTIAVLVVFLILELAAFLVRLLLTRLALAGLIALLALSGLSGLTTLLALSALSGPTALLTLSRLLTFLIHIVCHETLHAKRDDIAPRDFFGYRWPLVAAKHCKVG
jgi:hypothetical protein